MTTTRDATMHMVHAAWDGGSYQEDDGPRAAVTIVVQKPFLRTILTVKAATLNVAWSKAYDAVRNLLLLKVRHIEMAIARHDIAGETSEAATKRERLGRIFNELNGHAERDREAANVAPEEAQT
jgi:hypothetical protein